jgi:hypothetical protein
MGRPREFELVMREAVYMTRPSEAVVAIMGHRVEDEHILGCPIRAGSHEHPCVCASMVEALFDAGIEFTIKGKRIAATSTADPMIASICARLDALSERDAGRPGGPLLLAAVDYAKRACSQSLLGASFRAALHAAAASVRLDELEADEQERAVNEALRAFPRQRA